MQIQRLLFMVVCAATVHAAEFIDLEERAQDFVVHTQQVIIPGYPHAFNPAIIRWNNRLLMSIRVIPDPAHSFTSWIGLVWLDEQFQPVGPVQKMCLRDEESSVPCRSEDGRLISVDGSLYLVYSDNEDSVITRGGCRMYVAQLDFDGEQFIVMHKERLSHFDMNDNTRRERNWVPFEYQNRLLLAYSLMPHHILYPLFGGTERCITFADSESACAWNWGELRGGTPGILENGEYLAFFHSSTRMTTVHSQGREMRHYFMGAYTFSGEFPFNITRMSPEPIIGKNFYHGPKYKPYWGSLVAIFPCGFVMDDQYIWIAYGREDHETWIAQLDKKKLYKSLVPVAPKAKKHSINKKA